MPRCRASRTRRLTHQVCGIASGGTTAAVIAVLWAPVAAAEAAATAAARAIIPPVIQFSPCTDFLRKLREEIFALSQDLLDRFASAADLRAQKVEERLALLAARDATDGLLRLGEAFYLHFCRRSGCGRCTAETANEAPEALVVEVGLVARFEALTRRLLRLAVLLEDVAARVEMLAEVHKDRFPSQAILWRERVVAMRESLHLVGDEGLPWALETTSLGNKDDGLVGGLDGLMKLAGEFRRRIIAKMHGAVIETLDSVPLLVTAIRLTGALVPNFSSQLPSFAYIRGQAKDVVGEGGEGVSAALSMLTIEVTQGKSRLVMPFARTSVLCDAEGERLYRRDTQSVDFDNLPPYRDSSGSSSWHGASIKDLLDMLRHAGHSLTYNYWAVRPFGMYQREIECESAHGMLYDPTVCLEESGWGGLIFYLSPEESVDGDDYHSGEAVTRGGPRAFLQRRPKVWSGWMHIGSEDDKPRKRLKLEPSAWPVDAAREPVDVLFLNPLAGNCALLIDLIAPRGSLISLVMVPINPTFPPPLRVAPDFRPYWFKHVAWGTSAVEEHGVPLEEWLRRSFSNLFLVQCSFAQVDDILRPRGFEAVHVEHVYAVYARSDVAPLLRHASTPVTGPIETAQHPPVAPTAATVAAARAADTLQFFEQWRLGWFCSPLSRFMHSLEDNAPLDLAWLGPVSHLRAATMVCDFLARQGLVPDPVLSELRCPHAGPLSLASSQGATPGPLPPPSSPPTYLAAWPQAVWPEAAWPQTALQAPVAMRRRMQLALELADPLPAAAHHLAGGGLAGLAPGHRPPAGGSAVQGDHDGGGRARRAICATKQPVAAISFCECLAPYRGKRCEEEDRGNSVALSRPFSAAVQYIVNDETVHVAELLHALRNLWLRFNSRFDYPVLIFHDGLSPETRSQIALAAPHRLWLHRVPADFAPDGSALTPDLATGAKSEASHHSFSVGYRAQSRFRAGPVFAHPAVRSLDYIWSLDTDSMFPRNLTEDPFEVMHRNSSLVLGYQYLTVTSGTSSKNFWDYTLTYLGYSGINVIRARRDERRFLRKFLFAPQGFEEAPTWNNKVVMTDCDLARVSFFQPGTSYFRYFEFLDTLGGFWHHRWGDHAVRALGTALALWPHEDGRPGVPRRAAYEMHIPYAHQLSCFCEDPQLKCVSVAKDVSSDPSWPSGKTIWECRPNISDPNL